MSPPVSELTAGGYCQIDTDLIQALLGKLDCEIDNVQVFYHKVFTKLRDQVSKFHINPDFLQQESWDGIDQHELHYLLGGFIHCRSELKKLQRYGAVNACGFKRLLDKLGTSRSSGPTSTKLEDVESKLNSAQFSDQVDLLRELQLLQSAITSMNSRVLEAPPDSPLRVAITRGEKNSSELLLEFYHQERPSGNETGNALSGTLLADAVRSDPGILNELLLAGADIDHQGPHGETALYVAARSGDEESVKILVNNKANVDIAEKARNWTPLIVASVEGHVRIVQLLIDAGAAQEYQDLLGWTAIDHAAFRGHIALAKKLREGQAKSRPTSGEAPRGGATISRTVKRTRMALNECLILVHVDSFESCKCLGAPNLSPRLGPDNATLESEVGTSIEFFLAGKPDSSHTVDLPILEETINKPWAFYSKDPDNAKLMFKIYRQATNGNHYAESVHIGSGIALLNSLKPGLGCDRESLIRDYKIPILATNGLEDIGTVTFSFLLVKPHLHSTSFTSVKRDFWKSEGVTRVVGHRGMYFKRVFWLS